MVLGEIRRSDKVTETIQVMFTIINTEYLPVYKCYEILPIIYLITLTFLHQFTCQGCMYTIPMCI